MKVFDVITQIVQDGEVIDVTEYVTSDSGLEVVANHFAEQCEQYEAELISIRKLQTIVQHITEMK